MNSNNKIGIVTPLRNEVESIPKLFDSIMSQTIPIYYWLIVENDSTDGSINMLNEFKKKCKNVNKLEIINLKSLNSEYALGTKYATVVNTGFNHIKDTIINELDFIGILDADCFPEPKYFEVLTNEMRSRPKLGISSGMLYHDDGTRDFASKSWVQGGNRLWSIECFLDAGYYVAPSADTISACKAILKGWLVEPIHNIKVISRKMGEKVNYKYYGYSWYYRGHTLFFGLLVTMKLLFKGEFRRSTQFANGFFGSYYKQVPRIDDEEIINFYRHHLSRKLYNAIKK